MAMRAQELRALASDPTFTDCPRPVYALQDPLGRDECRPEQIDSPRHHQALAAMHHARKRYPGPVADILCSEIQSWKDLGVLTDPSSPVARLIRELMAPEAPNARPAGDGSAP